MADEIRLAIPEDTEFYLYLLEGLPQKRKELCIKWVSENESMSDVLIRYLSRKYGGIENLETGDGDEMGMIEFLRTADLWKKVYGEMEQVLHDSDYDNAKISEKTGLEPDIFNNKDDFNSRFKRMKFMETDKDDCCHKGGVSYFLEQMASGWVQRELLFLEKELDLKKGMKILDLGCGDGDISNGLALKGYEITGVDIDDTKLKYAKKVSNGLGLSAEYMTGDVRKISVNRSFDRALMTGAVMACWGGFSEEDRQETMNNAADALKKEGLFFFDTSQKDVENARKHLEEAGLTVRKVYDYKAAGPFGNNPHTVCIIAES